MQKLERTKMPRGAKDGRVWNFRRSYSSEDEPEPRISGPPRIPGPSGVLAPAELRLGTRTGPGLWWSVGVSVLLSAAAMALAGGFCALTYPILKELRAETVRGHDGTEQGILGFWSILVLSVFIGCVCFGVSWALTSIDAGERSGGLVLSLTQEKCRHASVHGVAVLNGIMGFITVIWSLT